MSPRPLCSQSACGILSAAVLLLSTAAFAQKTPLLVYTAAETEQLKTCQEAFNRVHPEIELKWVRDSTGVITARLLAEKANPQADVVMDVAATSLALLDKHGMLEPYAPLNLDAVMGHYRDRKKVPTWVGMAVWGATVCFSTVEAKKKGIPRVLRLRLLGKRVGADPHGGRGPVFTGAGPGQRLDAQPLGARAARILPARADPLRGFGSRAQCDPAQGSRGR